MAGLAHWFFGNLYEAVVDVPGLLAAARDDREPRLLGTGSPVRYYAPVAPLTLAATGATIVEGWRSRADRRAVLAAFAGTVTATGLTGYLVRTVNVRLLREGNRLPAAERRELVTRWHRVNAVRLVALATTGASLRALTTRDTA